MSRTITFSDAELEALKYWFPRITVANTVQEDTPEFTAIEKIAPGALPSSVRHPRVPHGCVGDPGAARCPHGCFYRCDG